MAELYTIGVNRVFYKAENFAAGKTVTAYFWSPTLVKSALQTLTELEEGLYYIDYNFAVAGVYGGKFYENGVGKAPGVFRVCGIETDITFLKDIEGGRWVIDKDANQMIFYKSDNITEVARFDLKNAEGDAAWANVFERVRA